MSMAKHSSSPSARSRCVSGRRRRPSTTTTRSFFGWDEEYWMGNPDYRDKIILIIATVDRGEDRGMKGWSALLSVATVLACSSRAILVAPAPTNAAGAQGRAGTGGSPGASDSAGSAGAAGAAM